MTMATISSPMSRLSVASSPRNGSDLLSSANSTLRQVDYDDDVTPLYEAIEKSEWDKAASLINSQDAATWVVRYERDIQGNKTSIQWRFLPIHSACALNPPASFLRKLVTAYPDGPRTLDDQGLLPLHHACGAKCSREAIYCLLMNFPQSALEEDPNGMLPMQYLEKCMGYTPRSFSAPFSTPKSGRKQRTLSWDNNDNENNNLNVSVSSSMSTTHLSTPPKSAPHAVHRHQMHRKAAFPFGSPRQAPPMSPKVFLPTSCRQTGRVTTSKATATQPEARQDDESGRGNQSIQSGSTNSTNLTQQLVEMAEIECRESLVSPRANRGFVSKKSEKSAPNTVLLKEIARLKTEKEKAEADLVKARGHLEEMVGSMELTSIGEDEMSRLTADDNEPEQSIATSSIEASATKTSQSVDPEIERLEEERDEKTHHGEVKDENHLQEVKSLRESLERATEEIANHQREIEELQKKELEWNTERENLEAEIKRLKEKEPSQNDDNSIDMSTLTNNSGLDGTVLKMKYENSVKAANDLRKFTANMRKEHNETITQLEGELDRERAEKTKIRSNVVSLEYRISTLEEELEATRSNKSTRKFNSEHIAELEASLQKESLTKYKLQEKVATLEKDLEDAMSDKKYGSDIDRMAYDLHQLKKRLSDKLEEAQKMKELLDAAKVEFERKEKNLLQQLDDTQEQWEQTKQRTIQEKEDECLEKIRHLKEEYEEKLQDKEDEYFQEMSELKKKLHDGNMNDPSFASDVNKLLEENEKALEEEGDDDRSTAEIDAIHQELESSDDGNALEAKFLEYKSDMKRQRREYRSEINKLKNSLEMQKSKEARLEGHIKTLEKQILDMTVEYEERIKEYEYGSAILSQL